MTQQERLVEAVNYLIQEPTYTKLLREVTDIIERWDTRPMVYAGKLAILNALVDVGVENRQAFERLVKLMDEKRKLLPQSKRMDYQRDLMRERRVRIAKATELHELTTGTLTNAAKEKFAKELQQRWRKARDKFIADKGELSWKDRNEAAGEFWQEIDTKLDINLAEARKKKKR